MIAFVFSGQGAQNTGMGKDIYDCSPAGRAVFDMADRLRPGTAAQCFTASKEELGITVNTQPCLFTVDLAAAAAMEEAGIHADLAAGFSLGEIAALAYAGALSAENAFRLVCHRAEYMHTAAERKKGAMLAILGLSAERVIALCNAVPGAEPVNFNCPGQVVAAGTEEAISALTPLVKEAGGKARPLAVSGAFHSSYMAEAAEKLGAYLEQVPLERPRIPLYANKTGEPYGADGKALVREQVCNPVQWQKTLENMAAAGADTFIEVGAGKVLCGLIGKTLPEARAFHYSMILQDKNILNK